MGGTALGLCSVALLSTNGLLPSTWLKEAEVERGNDDALMGCVVAKRKGTTDPAEQIVLMTVRDLVALLTAHRPEGP